MRAARALDEVGLLEQGDDALEIGERQALGLGDRLERDRLPGGLAAQLDEQAHSVLRLRREDHGLNPTNAVGDPRGPMGAPQASTGVSGTPEIWKDARVRADEGVVREGPVPPPPMARHRTLCIVAASVACSLVPAATASACAGARSRPSPASLERAVRATVCLINEARGDHGLGALRPPARWRGRRRAQPRHGSPRLLRARLAHGLDAQGAHRSRRLLRRRVVVGDGRDDRVGQRRARDAVVDRALVAAARPGTARSSSTAATSDLGVGIALGAPGHGDGATFTGDFGARG